MKKNLYYVATAFACFAMFATFAEARHGYKHDDDTKATMQNYEKGAKKMKDLSHWQQKKTNKITEEYDDAIAEIKKSSFSAEQKAMFEQQAAENRDLATKQLQERADLMKKHQDAVSAMAIDSAMHKDLEEVVEEIRDIF